MEVVEDGGEQHSAPFLERKEREALEFHEPYCNLMTMARLRRASRMNMMKEEICLNIAS